MPYIHKTLGAKVKRTLLLTLLCIFFVSLNQLAYAQDEYTPLELIFKVYSNGVTEVDYFVEADPTNLRFELPLIGDHFNGLVLKNQEGFFLDSSPTETGVIVDSIGSSFVNATYQTSSLTFKMGLIWSFNATVPIETLIILPSGAAIFDISRIPKDLYLVEGNQHLLMHSGNISISYLLGISSVKEEEAGSALAEAEKAINLAMNQGIVVTDAEDLFSQAAEQFDQQNYFKAKLLADQARNEAETILELASSARAQTFNLLLLGSFIIIIIVGIFIFTKKGGFSRLGLGKTEAVSSQEIVQKVEVNLDAIWKKYPGLRFDDKEVIKFIAEQNGEAFANEIRERFDMPRSSAWRMIRRMINEGIVEERKIGNQSLVRIRERFARTKQK